MADLLIITTYRDNYGRDVLDVTPDNPIRMQLYCWPCRTVHEFGLEDVEKIVYALGPVGDDQYSSGFDDGATPGAGPIRLPGDPQPCWLEVLRWADDSEMYAEHVEQGIECRERADG